MFELQDYAFKRQMISAFVILESALFATIYKINYDPDHNYGTEVVLENFDFNLLIGIIGGMGVLSVVFSFKPNWAKYAEKQDWRICTSNETPKPQITTKPQG